MKNIIDNVKDNMHKFREIYVFGMLAITIMLGIFIMVKVDLGSKILQYTSHKSNQNEVQIVRDFVTGMEIRQNFSCYENFDFITLSFSDHDQRLQGKVIVEISDLENGEIIIYEEIEASSIYYDIPVKISFDDIRGIADKRYEIVLRSLDTKDIALGVYGYKSEKFAAVINGQASEYALSIGIHSYTNLYQILTFFILGIGSLGIIVTILATFSFKLKEEQLFLILAIPFALCMLVIWPGNKVYDEERHYHTVYHYSNIVLGCAEQDSPYKIMMRQCDIQNNEVIESLGTSINSQAQEYKYYIDRAWETVGNKNMALVDVSNMPVVSDGTFIQYLPGIIGLTLGRVLGCNYFWMMTITRVTLISFYIGLCYIAIKNIPVLKILVVLLSAIPMNLYQAAGISYDGFTLAVGIVVFSFIIKLWIEGLTKKDWIKCGVMVFILGQCKGGVYLTLILLMLLIPQNKFEGKKWRKFGAVLGVAGISMVSSFLPTIVSWFIKPIVSEVPQQASVVINSGGVIAEKLHPFYVFEEPLEFVKMFVNTILENMDVYLGQMLGYRTAWSGKTIGMVIMLPFLILLLSASVNNEQENFIIGVKERIGILMIVITELVGMQMIFLIETPVYSDVIVGFQGRYFIAFVPCLLLIFRNNGVSFKEKQQYLYPCFSMAQLVYLYFFLELFMCA